MATQVQFRRGTTSQNNSFTGASGELSVDTTKNTLRLHNGSTVGGFELAKSDLSNHSGVGILTATQFVTGTSGNAIGINTNTISGPATITIDPAAVGDNTGTVVIAGNLQVDGTTTTVNSTTITVDDKNIVLGSGASNDAAADGGGITLESGQGNKTFNWIDATDSWTSSENMDLASGKTYKINDTNVLSSTQVLGKTIGGTSAGDIVSIDGTQTLTNKTLTSPVISSISNTGTLTLPTSTDTLVGRATTDTLTNKSINLANNTLTFTSTQLATACSDETGSGNLVFSVSPTFTGTVVASNINTSGIVTATDFNATSDINLKTNINNISNPLEKISQINGVTFNWKESNKPSAGVIAQEIEKILPELVNDGEIKSVNYNGLIGLLIEAVKDLSDEVNELKKIN